MELLHLADIRALLWLNHLVAPHPGLYQLLLTVTDRGTDVLLLVTTAWLWFWPEGARAADGTAMTRRQSRGRLIVFGAAAMAAYVVARLIAIGVERPRPFVTYLPVLGPPGVFEGLRTFGTFPSDHAALLWAVPIAMSTWRTGLGLAWLAMGVVATLARIAVGFHYPSDMLGGAVVGIAAAVVAMTLYDARGATHRLANVMAAGFSIPRYAAVLYLLLFLGGVEFAMHFRHVLGVLMALRERLA